MAPGGFEVQHVGEETVQPVTRMQKSSHSAQDHHLYMKTSALDVMKEQEERRS